MSLFPSEGLRIALTPGALGIARYSGRWRPSLVKTENVPVAQSDLDGVLASLSAWFAANKNPGAAVDFLVSSRFVRFALIPWSGALTSQEEQAALMLARFSEQYGDMSEWQMAADEAGDYGQPSLAFALPDRLLAGLSKLCNEFKLHCRQVQPYAVASLNAYARTSKASFYAIVENDTLVVVPIAGQGKDRYWSGVRSRALSKDEQQAAQFSATLEREALLQGLSVHAASVVDAPYGGQGKQGQTEHVSFRAPATGAIRMAMTGAGQ